MSPSASDAVGKSSRSGLFGWGVAALIVLLLLAFAGCLVPVQFLLTLAFGWVLYLGKTLPQLSVSMAGVATAVASLGGVIACLHLVARRLARNAALSAEPGEIEVRQEWPFQRSLAIVGFVLVMFVAGLSGTAMVHQIAWLATSPEPLTEGSIAMILAARQTQSKNNLKQIGLALHNYHDTYSMFVLGGTFDDLGRPHHGWMTNIVPFIEASPIFANVDRDRPWNHPANSGVFLAVMPVYLLPGVEPTRIGLDPMAPGATHYAASSYLLGANRGAALPEITDGASNTIAVGEAAGHYKAWADPTNIRDPTLGINTTPDGFGAPWEGGAQFVMGDGTVRFISEAIDPAVLEALATPAAGDRVSDDF